MLFDNTKILLDSRITESASYPRELNIVSSACYCKSSIMIYSSNQVLGEQEERKR
jgi:hypothetical protein